MKPSDRPYLSASLLKNSSEYYISQGNPLHRIIIKKGARILPLYALGKSYGYYEIIISTEKLKKHINHYVYK